VSGKPYLTRTRWATSCRKCHKNMPQGTSAILDPNRDRKEQYIHKTCATPEELAAAREQLMGSLW
jgi:hypothetical protein